MPKWKEIVVSATAPLGDVVAKINASGLRAALVVGADDALLGIVTDGNIRSAILTGKSLNVPVSEVMHLDPITMPPSTSNSDLLDMMRRLGIQHIPLVDEAGRVAGLKTLDELIGAVDRPNWVVLMAGGLGTRLQPLTAEFPKPLLAVGGRPILETILRSFADQGFKRIFLSVNFKAEMIRSHFGGGDELGVQLEYLHESAPRGTAGALALLPERPTAPFVVMNGDLLTRTNFENLLQFHDAQGAVATMAVREYDLQVPYGVVKLDGTRVEAITERPVHKFLVNAGIYALSPDALDHVPRDTFFDMPTLFDRLIADGAPTAAYPLWEYWLDIGRLEEFERAQREWDASGR